MRTPDWGVLDPRIVERLLWLPDDCRDGTTLIVGPPGCGKSRLLGRAIVWQDFARGLPGVLFDPIGEVRNLLFDKICRYPKSIQQRLWERIIYVDVSGSLGIVQRNPLLYRRERESLFNVSQRFVEAIRKIDPSLQSASVLGFNSFAHIATNVGMALAAMGLQFDAAEDLLTNTRAWEGQLLAAAVKEPQARPAVEYLLGVYDKLPPREKQNQTMTFLRKTAMLRLDPVLRQQFCQSPSDMALADVAKTRSLLIYDLSRISDAQIKKFALVWMLGQVFEFARTRPAGKQQVPFGVVVDELSYLLSSDIRQTDPVADDLMELTARLARNKHLFVTLTMQGVSQASKQVREALAYCSTYILGSTPDLEWATENAKRWRAWDPTWVKKTTTFTRPPSRMNPEGSANVTTQEYSLQEQWYLHAWKQMKLPRFHFFVAVPPREGSPASTLQTVSIEGFDSGQYPDQIRCEEICRRLAWRDGRPVEGVADIAAGSFTSFDHLVAIRQPAPPLRISARESLP